MLVQLQTRDSVMSVLDVAGHIYNALPPIAEQDGEMITISYRCRGQCNFLLSGTADDLQELAGVIERALSRAAQRAKEIAE